MRILEKHTLPMRGEAVVRIARGWIGTPYRHQASLKGEGCDCLGLVRGVWREIYGHEPEDPGPYSPLWAEVEANNAANERLLAAAQTHLLPAPDAAIVPGRVLLFRWRPDAVVKHCGIATAPDRFIHAHDGTQVAEVALIPAWRRRMVALFDFPAP